MLAVVLVGVGIAYAMFGRQDVPDRAPQRVSVFTNAARADLYGDAFNEAVLMRPGEYLTRSLVFFDNRRLDGMVNGLAALIGGTSGRMRRWQNGFVRSYALSMLGGSAVVVARDAGGEAHMNGSTTDLPWLTILALIPLVGAVALMALPRGGALPKQAALGISGLALVVSIIVAVQFDDRRRLPVRRAARVDPHLRGALRRRSRRSGSAPRAAHHHPHAGGDPRLVERRRRRPVERQRVLRPDALARGPGGRRLRRDRRVPVLRAVRGDADPDLLPDRRLRRCRSGRTQR